MENLSRAISTSFKQMKRSGWLGGASIAVMSLAVIVSSIFGFLAYASSLFLDSVEREPQIWVVFEKGTPEDKILQIQKNLESLEGVDQVLYTSSDQAKREFYESQRELNELAAQAVESRTLPAIIGIKLKSLDFADRVNQAVIEVKDANSEVQSIQYSKNVVDNIKEVFLWVRIGGAVILALLFIVIILFTLLTVEFRMHSRAEEIEIMQLVGGSLGYIRLPFILEGFFYGVLGAIVSNIIIGIMAGVIHYQLSNNQLQYLHSMLGKLEWPELSIPLIATLFIVITLLAGLLSAVNSFVAIRRYIK